MIGSGVLADFSAKKEGNVLFSSNSPHKTDAKTYDREKEEAEIADILDEINKMKKDSRI